MEEYNDNTYQRRYRSRRKSRSYARNKLMPIGFCLDQLIVSEKWSRQMEDTRITADWEAIVGKQVAQNISVRWLKNKILHVATTNSQWTAVVRFQKKQIISNINKFYGDEIVTEIVTDTVRPDDQKY